MVTENNTASLYEKQGKVEQLFIQLKDLSEMMINLAYSALIYNNTDIAEDVLELEDYIDQLHFRFQQTVLKQEYPNKPKYVNARIGLLRLATATEEIADAAEQIARNIIAGITTHPVLQMVVEEAEETIARVCISPESVLTTKTLGELGLENNIGMWIIAVKHGIDWIYNPDDEFRLQANDIVIARGYKEGRKPLEELASGSRTSI
ncbi:MAG: potassium channel family protein [Candidatus Ranarchaeia archaeon]